MSARPRPRSPTIAVSLRVESPAWGLARTWAATARRAIEACVAHVPLAPVAGAEISVLLADDERVRGLNATFRGKDKPTNVLSFPAATPDGSVLGDVVLARETVAREAAAAGRPLEAHATHLLVHGVLHLFGYDHESDADASVMEAAERRVLAALGLPDPYDGDDSLDHHRDRRERRPPGGGATTKFRRARAQRARPQA